MACDKSTRRANQQKPVQTVAQKYSAFAVGQITDLTPRVSPVTRGVAHVTNARWDAVDAMVTTDERDLLRTAKSCGPGAPMLALNFVDVVREVTVARKPVTGESAK